MLGVTSGCCCGDVGFTGRAKHAWFWSDFELIPGWRAQLFIRKNEDPYSNARQRFGSTFCGGEK